jgi:uncharacterized protein YraI
MFGAALVNTAQAQTGGCSTTHIVQRGETLYRIARQYGITVAELQARNSISNPNRIYAGQQLCISGGFVPPSVPATPPNNTWDNIGIVTARRLNIRTGPGMQFLIVRRAEQGEGLRLVGRTDNSRWYQVLDDPTSGRFVWASAAYVRTTNASRLPVVQGGSPAYSEYVTLIYDATVYNGPNTYYSIPPYQIFAGMTVHVIGRNADASWFQIRTDAGTAWLSRDVFPNALARYEFPVTG